jgi:hypothetical protein
MLKQAFCIRLHFAPFKWSFGIVFDAERFSGTTPALMRVGPDLMAAGPREGGERSLEKGWCACRS